MIVPGKRKEKKRKEKKRKKKKKRKEEKEEKEEKEGLAFRGPKGGKELERGLFQVMGKELLNQDRGRVNQGA